jgi:hypothetical protein
MGLVIGDWELLVRDDTVTMRDLSGEREELTVFVDSFSEALTELGDRYRGAAE